MYTKTIGNLLTPKTRQITRADNDTLEGWTKGRNLKVDSMSESHWSNSVDPLRQLRQWEPCPAPPRCTSEGHVGCDNPAICRTSWAMRGTKDTSTTKSRIHQDIGFRWKARRTHGGHTSPSEGNTIANGQQPLLEPSTRSNPSFIRFM